MQGDNVTGGPPGERPFDLTRAMFLRRAFGSAAALTGGSVLLAACGSAGNAGGTNAAPVGRPPARPTGSIVATVYGPCESIDPARKGSYQTYFVEEAAYDGLTNWGQEPTRLLPGLATAWESNDDATEWTFTLRDGVRFQDGEPLTSEAVAKSFEHYLRGKGSFMGAYVGEFDSVDTSDPLKAVVKYKQPFPDLARNAPWLGLISPKALTGTPDQVAKRLDNASAGAGAFRISRSQNGGTVTATAFEDYWGDGPYLEQITFRAVPEESARIAGLRSGDVDWIPQVSPQPLPDLERQFNSSSVVSWLQQLIIMACDQEPTNDPRVRQAIAYALDRDLIIRTVLQGQAAFPESSMPPGTYGYAPAATQYARDLDKAKALLAEVGDVAPISVAYFTDQDVTVQVGQAMAAQLREAGFDVTASGLTGADSGNEFDPTKRRKFHVLMTQFGWINGGPFFFAPGGAFNLASIARYRDPAYLRLLDDASSVADGPKRLQLLKQVQDDTASSAYTLPLFNLKTTDVFAKDLTGYVVPKDGFGPRFETTYKVS